MAQSKRVNWDSLPVREDLNRRTLLVESNRHRGPILPEEIREGERVTIVDYGAFEILTEEGLKLLVHDMGGMEPTLELLQRNADRRNNPSLLETPAELFGSVTNCSGLIIRPPSWQRDKMIHWTAENGAFLMHYFGEGVSLATMPAYEIRSLSLVQTA